MAKTLEYVIEIWFALVWLGQMFKNYDLFFFYHYRFFVLNNEAGLLEYFVNEQSRNQKPRGTLQLAGAVISPSDEDSHTFTVNAASGEQYKLRGMIEIWAFVVWFSFSFEKLVYFPDFIWVLEIDTTITDDVDKIFLPLELL